jgi:hypothetical protein
VGSVKLQWTSAKRSSLQLTASSFTRSSEIH